jgi:hypothetical protein
MKNIFSGHCLTYSFFVAFIAFSKEWVRNGENWTNIVFPKQTMKPARLPEKKKSFNKKV